MQIRYTDVCSGDEADKISALMWIWVKKAGLIGHQCELMDEKEIGTEKDQPKTN
jgi:hypothetical protein